MAFQTVKETLGYIPEVAACIPYYINGDMAAKSLRKFVGNWRSAPMSAISEPDMAVHAPDEIGFIDGEQYTLTDTQQEQAI